MKHAMGQINLFEIHHFGFESEHFYALKTKSVRHSVECSSMLKHALIILPVTHK